MSATLITSNHPVFGAQIAGLLATSEGQQLLAYLNASPTARADIAAMQSGPTKQTIEIGPYTQYNSAEQVAQFKQSEWDSSDAGTIAGRLLHELGHARDPEPPASAENFHTPGAYADARAANERSAFWFLYRFRQDIVAHNAVHPLASGRLRVPPTNEATKK
jgi:hypothetical protein